MLLMLLLDYQLELIESNSFPLAGDPSSDWTSDGAEDEPAAVQSAKHAAGSSATQQIIASKYT